MSAFIHLNFPDLSAISLIQILIEDIFTSKNELRYHI